MSREAVEELVSVAAAHSSRIPLHAGDSLRLPSPRVSGEKVAGAGQCEPDQPCNSPHPPAFAVILARKVTDGRRLHATYNRAEARAAPAAPGNFEPAMEVPMSLTRILLAGLGLCALAGASAASPLTLNVRPGLWEMTSQSETQGIPGLPPELLARMTPAQRAKVEAMMAASRANARKPHSEKTCATEKDLRQGFDLGEHEPGVKCTRTVLSRSATAMEVRTVCRGGPRHSTGHFHFEAPNPTTMNGTFEVTMREGTHVMAVKSVMHGHWLGPDCGKYAHVHE